MPKIEVFSAGVLPDKTQTTLAGLFTIRREGDDLSGVRGLARGGHFDVDRGLIERLPKLEIIANFGVGYDGIDLKASPPSAASSSPTRRTC